ncbi:dTMP kinase [Granulicoccus phenolivorans]|uniref:dTMP kinase n=1 Tax=Granulicoccus phenolivorans TaxID=266854 RepID=UPI000418476C|nr:dTMP kinase [Granulicoccus phenolivorans]
MRAEAAAGLFLVFEGGDGAGKTTQTQRLARWLETDCREQVVCTREPGGSPIGSHIRRILLDPAHDRLAPRAEALLYAADRAQHVAEVLLPALDAGRIVISDRYVDSSLAYQGVGRTLGHGDLVQLNEWATDGLRPDLTVLLDVRPEDAVSQKAGKDRLEAESLEFHRAVRQAFLDLAAADPDHYLVLPARDSRDRIEEAVRARVRPLLDNLAARRRQAEWSDLSARPGRMEP